MNLFYALRKVPLSQIENPLPFIIGCINEYGFIIIRGNAENPKGLAKQYCSELDILIEKQRADKNSHWLSYRPPKNAGLYSLNIKSEKRAIHFRLEELTMQEREEFESALANLSK